MASSRASNGLSSTSPETEHVKNPTIFAAPFLHLAQGFYYQTGQTGKTLFMRVTNFKNRFFTDKLSKTIVNRRCFNYGMCQNYYKGSNKSFFT